MPDEHGRPYVYLAGPDVFYPDALLRGAKMKEALTARGMAGLFPLDDEIHPSDYRDLKRYALAIAASCEAQMRKADLGIFNIEPWRGPEADDGTAYELGFMTALGKPSVLYTNDPRPFAERLIADVYGGDVCEDGSVKRAARDGTMIEDFGLSDNLMLIGAAARTALGLLGGEADPAAIVHASFESAADFAIAIWKHLEAQGR